MTTIIVIFKILFLVLIAHSCCCWLAVAIVQEERSNSPMNDTKKNFPPTINTNKRNHHQRRQTQPEIANINHHQNNHNNYRELNQDDPQGRASIVDSSSVQQKLILPPPITTTTSSLHDDHLLISSTAEAVSFQPSETASTVSSSSSSKSNQVDEDHHLRLHHHDNSDDVDKTREQLPTTRSRSNSSSNQLLFSRTGQLAPISDTSSVAGGKISAERRDQNVEDDVNYAELCYLSNGGSSLTLTVNEASPVGLVIGTIEVNGDPALEGGNIDLFDDVNSFASSNTDSSTTTSASAIATPSAISRTSTSASAGNHSSALQVVSATAVIAEQQTTASSTSLLSTASQQARQLSQRIHRLVGKRSTNIGFHDQLLTGSNQLRQSQTLLVAGSSNNQQHNNHWTTIGSINNNNNNNMNMNRQQHTRDGKFIPALASVVAPQPNSNFYTLLASGGTQTVSVSAPPPAQLPPAVRLEPGTRNLILVRQLDKESPEGEQSLLINIRCSPRRGGQTSQSSNSKEFTTIPVRIIVTDANDHAPEFLGPQPFVVNISETTPLETIVLRDIEAIDRDSAGPFSTIHYRVAEDPAAPHSSWLQFVNPLVPNLMVAHQLDYETQASFQLTIIAQDEGEPEPLWSSAQVQVNIIDFDDQNPRFLDEKYTLIMDETQQNLVGQNLQVLPRNLYAEDGDQGINAPILYSFDQLSSSSSSGSTSSGNSAQQEQVGADPIHSSQASSSSSSSSSVAGALSATADNNQQFNVNHYLHLNPSTGEIRLLRQWPSRLTQTPMTLVIKATQADNKDRYTLTTLTITTTRSSTLSSSSLSSSSSSSSSSSLSAITSSLSSNETKHKQQGIEFEPNQVSVRVPENAPINEKIARVKARYIQQQQQQQHQLQPQHHNSATDHENHQVSDQAVDVLVHSSLGANEQAVKNSNRLSSTNTVASLRLASSAAEKRPINYQILDDQTDQFGINGLGEIFIKRPLDYEQKQEFKFRVLATYLKYSDICRVHVEVLNINDNKPKFTQPQYIFHITESRLRSNFIGQVQAHDADLNDTVRYSLSGEQAHLFNIHPSTGQVSLRSSIKQLNITSCQLIVIATDSLSSGASGGIGSSGAQSNGQQQQQPQQFTHQARLNLHIAPQLVGRSINFDYNNNNQQSSSHGDTKVFSSRSLTESSSSSTVETWLPGSNGSNGFNGQQTKLITAQQQQQQQKDLNNNQRSSVATVMASLQHMVKSVNFFDMPMSSALLLSALLAFLLCLLFILLVSMSVHIYRNQVNKSLNRRQQHLAATAAHIRHAHLAASGQLLANSSSSVCAPQQMPALTRYLQQSPSARSTNSTNTTPANSNGQSPPGSLHQQVIATSGGGSGGGIGIQTIANNNKYRTGLLLSTQPKLTAKVSPATTVTIRPASVLSRLSQQQQQSGPVSLEPLETLSAQLQQRRASQQHLLMQQQQQQQQQFDGSLQLSVVSSPSSGRRSKHSYRSSENDNDNDHNNEGDDDDDDDNGSSVMNFGHYSVNNSCRRQYNNTKSVTTNQPQMSSDDRDGKDCNILDNNGQQLVRTHNQSDQSTDCHDNDDDLENIMNDDGSPGIKLYRKLPANLGSLARPQVNKFNVSQQSQTQTQPTQNNTTKGLVVIHQDSAIASDESSSSSKDNMMRQQAQNDQEGQQQLIYTREDPDIRVPSPPLCRTGNLIRWPMPQRVKKLTWDDELSQQSNSNDDDNNDHPAIGDCYLAPDYATNINQHSRQFNYHHGQLKQQADHSADQIFSNPCSPAPQSTSLAFHLASTNTSQLDESSIIGQNNCFDYTIVENSQFQVQDVLSSLVSSSLSAQHYYSQQQQQQQQQQQHLLAAKLPPLTKTTSYLYSSNGSFQGNKRIPTNINNTNNQQQQRQQQQRLSTTPNNQQDLITTAVL